jgi:DNA-binding response OmpR family regulator
MKKLLKKLLLVEDDHNLSFVIKSNLVQEGYDVDTAYDGKSGLQNALTNKYALLLIDIGLPEINGLSLVEKLRNNELKTPVIIITDHIGQEFEIHSFKIGANIFHKKPINYELLFTQIASLLKMNYYKPVIQIADLYIDTEKRYLKRGERVVHLSKKEFEIVSLIVAAYGDVLSRRDLLDKTFQGVLEAEEGSIDTLISRVRKKLGQYKGHDIIETIHGVGYRLNIVLLKDQAATQRSA